MSGVAPTASTPLPAPTPGSIAGSGQLIIPEKTELRYPKVGSMLDDLIARVEAGEISAEDAAGEAPLHRGESVAVTIYLSGNVDGVVRFLQDNGVSPRNVGEDYIEAFIPIPLLPQTSEQPGVLRVEVVIPAKSFQGATRIAGNGPAAHGSPAWNQAGYRGQGIKVGIIDSGFEGFSGLMGTELPQSVRARCYPEDNDTPTDETTDCAWDGAHGTVVAESVMDISPEVALYIANSQSKGDLQAAVQWMIGQGVDVINHSVGWPFDGPGDGTSPISWSPLSTVDGAVDEEIVWVNAAGNDARTTWFGSPSDADGDGAIEFAMDDEKYDFDLFCDRPPCALTVQLRWDDSWSGAVRDLDFYIYDRDDSRKLGGSDREQSGSSGETPFESISGDGSGRFYIGVLNRSSSMPSWIQLTLWGDIVVEYYTDNGSITNPAESKNSGMLTVGAAHWEDVDTIRFYSSRGPTPDGRIKPDLVGADCGQTATSSRFCGTSQAAPHVAGLAALVRQRFPGYSPAQVVSYLKENAEQRIGSPDPNNTWGHGFIVLPPITTGVASISDLVVDAPTVSEDAPAAGARFTLSATVRNQSSGPTDSTTLRYYQSTDSTITTGDTEVGTDSVSGLDASQSGDESVSLTAPSIAAVYYYGACVEAVSGEYDMTNNCSLAVTVTVGAAPAPDLVVDAPTVSEDAPAAGARFTLSATVRNQGSGPTGSTTLRYYQSTDATITTGDTEVGTDSVLRLDPSESGDESISLTAPSTPGTYYYGTCVDAVSDESDTTNNCSPAVTVSVGAAPAPDLVVDAPTVSERAPAAGARFSLNATVRNQDNGPADSTTLRYYQSTDSTITTGDTEVGTDSVSGLDASQSGDESISLTAPSDPGTYYYGACMDAVSDESDTQNNCSLAVTVTVGAAPAPDLVVDTPTVSESAPAAGARFTLNATVRNQGNGPSAFTTLRYYQSSDSTITTGDTEVGTDSVSGIGASGSGDESISLDAPSTPGTYYYGACVEVVSDESDAANNCSPAVTVTVGAAPTPDLVVDVPTVDTSAPVAGARFTLNATVRNQGNGPADSTTLRYYQSTDSTITTGDTEVGTDSVSGLDASQSGDESISLTAPSDPGTYYYGACVDAVSDESDTQNNCSLAVTVTVGAAPAPDLVVDTPTVSESAQAAGARFTLNATVRNQGNGRSDSTRLRYYQSTDPTITTDDTEVGTDSVFRLNAAGSGDESIILTVPTTPGTYYYGACVEAVSDESDTTNNCSPAVTVSVGAAPAPDLVVDAPTVSESAQEAGARFTLSATVRNQGNGPSAFTTLRYYQSSDSTITTGDTEVGTDSVSRLDASESGDESISLTAPSTPGTYYYAACVDEVSGELDTTNNCSLSVTLTVGAAPAPDLVVDTPTVSESSSAAGASFTLSATVRNQGAARSDSTMLRYYQSTDSTITADDTEVGTDSVFGLAASRSRDESISLTAPSTPGTYYYGACVDSVSDESDTTNNCSAAVTVTVGAAPAPDLVVDTPTVSENAPAAGARFTLSARVRNQGNGRSESTTLRYHQSTDPTITTGDTEVGTDSVSGLAASASGDESISLTAPSQQGTYYYGACVDEVDGESDTQNNCSAAVTVVVGAAPAPDLVVDTPTVSESAPTAGARFTLSATVRNQGNGSSAFTTLRYYQSTDSTITSVDMEIGTDSVLPLDALGIWETTISLTAPSAPGTYYYYGACVDEVSNESDATNNCSDAVTIAAGITESDGPVGVPEIPTGVQASKVDLPLRGDDARVTWHAVEGATYYEVYQGSSKDAEVSAPQTSYRDTEPRRGLFGALLATRYAVKACNEAGCSDYSASASTHGDGPAPAFDLIVDTPTVSESAPAAGTRFTLSASIRNQGSGRSVSSTLRYYRSSDPTITTGDIDVGTDSVPSLDPSESGEESISLTAPSEQGTYYYGACVDEGPDESDTQNNCSAAVTVTVRAAPDNPANQRFSWQASTIVVSWEQVAGAEYYNIYYDDFFDSSCRLVFGRPNLCEELAANVVGTSYTHTDPDADANYYWITACNNTGCSDIDSGNPARLEGSAPAPDLVMDAPTVSESYPAAGARFTLSATVRNQGNGSSAFTTLRYYRSTDPTISSGDTEVGTDSVSSLDASGSEDESISLTAPSTPGAYYYGACVDAVSDESDTTNSCSPAVTVTVGAAPAPDLVVDTPTVSESSPAAGASFTLNATVRNQGAARSSSTTLRYYQSTDATITADDTEVGTDSVFGLAASRSRDESISLTAPSTPGTYYYGACVDEVSGESDTTNNCSTSVTVVVGAAPAPDLVVDTPTVDTSTPAAGDRFLLRATVRNQGNGPSAFTSLRYYQSSDSTITTGDTEVDTNSVSRYDAAEGGEEWSYLDAPPIPGTYYFGACVDAVTGESDTTNNCSTAVTITVRPGSTPDLVVDTPTVSQSAPPAGTSFTLNATVRNRGNRASASTWLRFYHSSDATITSSDTLVSTNIYVDGLNPSGSSAKWANLTAPSTAGTYYYGACVDSVRSESDTTNNCSVAVTVVVGAAPASDLVVDTLTVSDSSPTAGASFTLSARVHNQGSGQSASTTLRYYRSTDSTITTGDTSVDTDSIPKISPSWSSPQSISMTVPSTPGTYYYGACVDTVTGESDTANNCSVAVTVVVNAAPAPDLVIDTPTVSDSSPTAGAFFTLNATVRNRGNGPSATTALYYWRATVTESSIGGFSEVGTDTVDTLAASGASNVSISLTAPATPGMYDFSVSVNPVPEESNTNNNHSDVVRIIVQSAMKPGAPTGLTATADGPTEIDLSWTAPSDDGGTDITGYRTEVSTNGSSWSDLVANTNSTATSYSHTGLTAWSTRHYRVSAINSAGTGTASNTANATTGAAPGPDLVVDTPTASDIHPIVGTVFVLYATVRNQGADASGPATLLFYRSTDSTITTSDERIGAGSTISGLSPTETDYLSDSSRAPSTPGTYYYGACVVSSKDESNTENNCSPALTIIPGRQPDLVVETPWISHSSATAASIMDLHAVVRNQGTGPVQGFPAATFDVVLSTDSTIGLGDTRANGFLWRHMNISSGSEEGLTVSFRVPSTAGEYYYYACVEVVRGESDTTNNCSAAVKVTVRPPDLTILLPTVSSHSTTAGESFTLNVTVLNQGDVRSADSSATIRYYRSIDATITSEDTLVLGGVGTDWVLVPNAHATTDRSISLTAPSKTGTYYYGACVDAVSGESDTTNNCSEAVEVTVGPRPLSLRLTSCFVFQNQHFVRFQVTANVDLSSVVVHTYQVEGRNNKLHLMRTTDVGNLAAGSSYSKLTSRYFPAHLRRHLTTCTASLEWDDGTAAPGFTPDLTTVPDLPPPPPTYAPPAYDPSEFRNPTKHQVYGLFGAIIGTIYRHHMACGHAGAPPCPGQDHIAWWSALPSGLQRCAFVGGCHFPQDPN